MSNNSIENLTYYSGSVLQQLKAAICLPHAKQLMRILEGGNFEWQQGDE
jgi:hypothetical protein